MPDMLFLDEKIVKIAQRWGLLLQNPVDLWQPWSSVPNTIVLPYYTL